MEDDKFRAQILALRMNKMATGMRGDEFAVYCLVNKHVWENIPLSWWIHRFEPEYKWLIKRTLRENFIRNKCPVVNWLPIRRALLRAVNRDDPAYVRHLFDLQPQRN